MSGARFAHVNLIARDWRALAAFYAEVFGCEPAGPERDIGEPWLGRVNGLPGSRLRGVHLRLPGHGPSGPTLEIFEYDAPDLRPPAAPHTVGFGHVAFAVDDLARTAHAIEARGGSPVGERAQVEIPGAGRLEVQYLRDPEGNIIELQRWS